MPANEYKISLAGIKQGSEGVGKIERFSDYGSEGCGFELCQARQRFGGLRKSGLTTL